MPSRSPPSSSCLAASPLHHQPLFLDRRRPRTNSASSQQQLAEEEWVMVSTIGSSMKQRQQMEQSSLPIKEPTTKKTEAVVVVDPISSGAVLALLAQQRGYAVLAVYSDGLEEELLTLVPAQCREGGLRFAHVLMHEAGRLDATVAALRALGQEEFCIKQVLVGCESGVALYDALTHALATDQDSFPSLRDASSNEQGLSAARRDKYLMSETVRRAGLRAARQLKTASWEEALPFLRELAASHPQGKLQAVLKPLASAGSDGVYFASSEQEARTAFDTILGGKNVFGAENAAVLVQEFLQGTEYVVDSISHRGQHRATCLWRYDKRPTNDAAFVYYGLRLFETPDRAREEALAAYAHACLDALGIRSGFSHAEVMWLEGEDRPCLVEVGARPHGGEGTFVALTEAPIGYNQLSVALDLIEDAGASLDALPVIPAPLKAHAAEVCLVSRKAGRLLQHRLDHVQRTLPSVVSVELHVQVGQFIRKTVDMLSSPGSAILCHGDRAVLEADYEAIHQMDLFLVQEEEEEEEEEEQPARCPSRVLLASLGESGESDGSEGDTTTSGASSVVGEEEAELERRY